MEQQKRQHLLLIFFIAAVLIGGFYSWLQQEKSSAATAPTVPVAAELPSTMSEVVVYVSGYIVRPGVYTLSGEPRAIDAVNAAGGFATGANAAGINLAQKLRDGMQINVPGSLSASGPGVSAEIIGKIHINTADKKQLETLPGVGPALAERILEYRTVHNGFKALDELKKVSGIGEAKYKALKDKIIL